MTFYVKLYIIPVSKGSKLRSLLKANFKKYLGGLSLNFFKRKQVNFQNKSLVICKMGIVTKKENSWDKWGEYIEWKSIALPKYRILVSGRKYIKFYEPDRSKIYYPSNYSYKRRVKIGDLVVKTATIPIQYVQFIKLTEEEERTKTITIERIKELEDLLNSK